MACRLTLPTLVNEKEVDLCKAVGLKWRWMGNQCEVALSLVMLINFYLSIRTMNVNVVIRIIITFDKGLFDISSLVRFVKSLRSKGREVMFAFRKFNYDDNDNVDVCVFIVLRICFVCLEFERTHQMMMIKCCCCCCSIPFSFNYYMYVICIIHM